MPDEIKNNKRKPRKRRKKRADGEIHRGIYILPNFFTTCNIFAGFFGIISAIGGKYETAAVAVGFSWVFDVIDGKVARITRSTSRFGVEYDSLADLVAFGVSPALLMYMWALQPYGRWGWGAAFIYIACAALRLARFNVQIEAVDKRYFMGLPSPGAAGVMAATVILMSAYEGPHIPNASIILLIMTGFLGFLMVSNIPYNSFKELPMLKSKPLPALFVLVVLLSVIAANPRIMVFSMLLAYGLSGPVAYLFRLGKRPRNMRDDQVPEPVDKELPSVSE